MRKDKNTGIWNVEDRSDLGTIKSPNGKTAKVELKEYYTYSRSPNGTIRRNNMSFKTVTTSDTSNTSKSTSLLRK